MLATLTHRLLGRLYQGTEKWMRPVRSGRELRMELGAYHERMVTHLADLNQLAIRGQPRGHKASLAQRIAVLVVELKAVAVPLEDLWHPIGGGSPGPRHQVARV